jgi:heme A synthase
MNAFRTILRYWLWLMLALVILQIGFAGYGAFDTADKVSNGSVDEKAFEDSFGLHTGFGYLIVLGGLITLLIALAARPGRQRVLHALGIFILLIIQVLLAWTGGAVPAIFGALHPINAMLILGAVASLGYRLRKDEEAAGRMVGATIAPPPSAAA